MNEYNIALYPGDGIGIEVTLEATRVLKALEEKFQSFRLNIEEFDWGSRYWRRTGKVVPDDFLDIVRPFDAIYLGAVGDPDNVPDHITLVPLLKMRQEFNQYVCLRPARLLPGVDSPLADKVAGDIDIMVVRENSEGEYINRGEIRNKGRADDQALQTAVHTRKGIERILHYAFKLARRRQQHVTMATKSNALKFGMVFWDQVLEDVAPDYPDIRCDKCHIDALAMNFVRCPENYDVVVGSNLFGDILSDLSGAIVGSLGIMPSSNINPERDFPSLFEPVHGSGPDIVGQGIANPVAAILSAQLMVDFLGETAAAALLEKAVLDNLADGVVRTGDIGGTATTVEVGDDIVRRIRAA